MKTLYKLKDEYLGLMAIVAESGPQLDDELSLALDRLLATMADDEPANLEYYRQTIARLELEASGARAERDQYAMMATTRENAAKRMKDRVKDYLESTGRTRAETSTGRVFAIQTNGGKQPLRLAENIDLSKLPEDLLKIAVSVDTDAVRKRLDAGDVFDWATLEPRGSHLRIR